MKTALLFAFLSLCCTSVNDLVFKFFADRKRSLGGFIFLVGFFWMLAVLPLKLDWSHAGATWLYGLVSGTFSVTANFFLVEAMKRQSAGLCSTIYRLNMVLVVAGAFLFLGEKISPLQWVGIGLALAAVIAFMPTKDKAVGAAAALTGAGRWGFVLAVSAAVLRAFMGLAYKVAFVHKVQENALVFVNCLCWMAGGILYSLLVEKKNWVKDKVVYGYGFASGLLVTGVVIGMACSVSKGEASVVLPIAQMSFLATCILSRIFLKEELTTRKISAIALGVGAIVLLAWGA